MLPQDQSPSSLKEFMQVILADKLQYFSSICTSNGNHPPKADIEMRRIRTAMAHKADIIRKKISEQGPLDGRSALHLEFELVATVVAQAVMNPVSTQWDISRLADRVKNSVVNSDGSSSAADTNLSKYFPLSGVDHISDSAVLLDIHGRIALWHLDGAIHPNRVDNYNRATSELSDLLQAKYRKSLNDPSSWRHQGFQHPENTQFHPGTADFSPGWFMQRQDRLVDKLHVSTDLQNPRGMKFVDSVAHGEVLHNAILSLIAPDLYDTSHQAIEMLKNDQKATWLASFHPHVSRWPSVFSAWQVIVNRITPPHRDPGAAPSMYDVLTSVGTHTSSDLILSDCGTTLSYGPGTVIAICGRVLRHEVRSWEGGERICVAHYLRDNVHNRLRVPCPGWVVIDRFWDLLNEGLRERQSMDLDNVKAGRFL